MKCPYEPVECDCIDTSGMDQGTACDKCLHYPDPVKKLMAAYALEQMIEFLPKTIIKERKLVFRYNEIFDLNISKDGLDNWVITYLNDKSLKSLFAVKNISLHRCTALILADLIGNNYIQALKTHK
jgi:hypothetical protein